MLQDLAKNDKQRDGCWVYNCDPEIQPNHRRFWTIPRNKSPTDAPTYLGPMYKHLNGATRTSNYSNPNSGNVRLGTQISLLEQQFVVTHAIRHTEIPTLLDSWVTNTPSVKILCSQTNCLSLHFRENMTCLSVAPLMTSKVFSVSCITGDGRVATNYCFMSNIFIT